MERASIQISGMSCAGCVNSVKNALGRVPGVVVHQVEIGAATVNYDPGITSLDAIYSAVVKAGFKPLP